MPLSGSRLGPGFVAFALLLAGCQQMERLSFIRPSAQPRGYTQVAPSYDVSGKKGRAESDPVLLLLSANDQLQRGQYAEAERLARQALKLRPDSGDAQTLLGAIASARGDAAAAGKAYRAAVQIAPGNGVYANNYGNWLCANGQAADALPWFERALADPTYPTPVAALVNAGTCAMRAGQPERAESNWRRALELDPQNLTALAGMAALEQERGNGLDARAFVERWLALSPEDPAGLRLAADIEQKLGDNAAASRYLSRLQAISSTSATPPRTQ
ncbi:type IV pilus biogenesis/stability protein PilW [Thermomonas alba]|uniref:type IV pilus biogenesis/stability protein PilW n=1 Tax=Thermomonas alba TaxID=2888525 RepID=UPI001F033ED4|nr:type IV pilus biogenesis/stability protein PilW [Thermomonas alba]